MRKEEQSLMQSHTRMCSEGEGCGCPYHASVYARWCNHKIVKRFKEGKAAHDWLGSMHLLAEARSGNQESYRVLVDGVANTYSGMIASYYTVDPVLGLDDIKQEFYWGIWRHVPKLDHRGDPIYHLAMRGQWAVRSVIVAVNRHRHGTTAKEGGVTVVSLDADSSAYAEPTVDCVETEACTVAEHNEHRNHAMNMVSDIVAHKRTRPSHKRALDAIFDKNIDLSQLGAKRQLAKALGVSGQRVSVVVKQLESIATEVAAA